jgi:hypothetical protein
MELGHSRTSAITSRKMGTLHESYPPFFILARSAKQKSVNLTKFPSLHGACTNSLTLPTKKTFNDVKKIQTCHIMPPELLKKRQTWFAARPAVHAFLLYPYYLRVVSTFWLAHLP